MLESYTLPVLAQRLASYASATDSSAPGNRAAVAVILKPGRSEGSADVLLIRRAEHPNDPWSGHMALPGGRHDPTDADLTQTAVRETLEEVGVDLGRQGRLLARLPDHPAIVRGKNVGLVIAPFVFALESDAALIPNAEIAEALWTPFAPLARGDNKGTFLYNHEGTNYHLPYLDVGGRRVWGLTYQMLQELFRVVHGG